MGYTSPRGVVLCIPPATPRAMCLIEGLVIATPSGPIFFTNTATALRTATLLLPGTSPLPPPAHPLHGSTLAAARAYHVDPLHARLPLTPAPIDLSPPPLNQRQHLPPFTEPRPPPPPAAAPACRCTPGTCGRRCPRAARSCPSTAPSGSPTPRRPPPPPAGRAPRCTR